MAKRKAIYTPTVNYEALKKLDGLILDNFLELVQKVILIDNTPFAEWTYIDEEGNAKGLKITNGRKKEFLSQIKRFAIVEFVGIKCHILTVLDENAIEELRKAKIQKHIEKI